MADEEKPLVIKEVAPAEGPGGAFAALAKIETRDAEKMRVFRKEFAVLLDNVRLSRLRASQISDCGSKFLRKVTGKWQHELNVLKLDDVKTRAVDMV